MGSIELFVFSASIDFFHFFFFFSFFFFPVFFSAGKMRIIFLFFFLSYIILESNSIHGKTVSGVRERESDASSAVRNLKERRRKIINWHNYPQINITNIPKLTNFPDLVEIATEIGKGIKQSFAL